MVESRLRKLVVPNTFACQGWRLLHVEMSEYFHYPVRDGHGHPAWLAIAERL